MTREQMLRRLSIAKDALGEIIDADDKEVMRLLGEAEMAIRGARVRLMELDKAEAAKRWETGG